MNRTFSTFHEASQYAADFCAQHKTSARLSRQGDLWKVLPSDELIEREKEEAELAKERAVAEEAAQEEALRTSVGRAEWKAYYDGLTKEELMAIWHISLPLEEWRYVRGLIRVRSGFPLNLP